MIAPDDRGFTLGDGLFETVLAIDGELADWTAHRARLEAGCAALGLPAPDSDASLRAAMRALSEGGLASGRAAVRITWSAGRGGRGLDRPAQVVPVLTVSAAPAPAVIQPPARMVTAQVRRNDLSPASRHKTLSYLDNILARAEAHGVGADEALMLNTRGQVACAAAANVFWQVGGRLYTPALDCGVLAGVTRGRIIAALAETSSPVIETRAGREALDAAEAIFLTNSLIGARDVAALDGRALTQQVGQAMFATLRGS